MMKLDESRLTLLIQIRVKIFPFVIDNEEGLPLERLVKLLKGKLRSSWAWFRIENLTGLLASSV